MIGRQKSIGILLIMIILGMVIGTLVGELIGLLLPESLDDSNVKKFFLTSVDLSYGPHDINLVAFAFHFGISLTVNIMGVLGIVFAAYLFRWY